MTPKRISRRRFLTSSLAGGVLAGSVLAGGTLTASNLTLTGCSSTNSVDKLIATAAQNAPQAHIQYLRVDPTQVLPYTDMTNVSYQDYLKETSSFELPLGSLLYQSSPTRALVIGPGDSSRYLIRLDMTSLYDGSRTPLLNQALGANEDYVIYDARASDSALIWVESNMIDDIWRVYAATLTNGAPSPIAEATSGGASGADGTAGEKTAGGSGASGASTLPQAILLDKGGPDFEPPLLAVSGNKVYWTVMPDPTGLASQEDSLLRCALLNPQQPGAKPEPRTIYTSHGRMITNPQVSGDVLTIVPRADADSVYYQLTALGINDDVVRNVAILPPSLRVSDAVWLDEGFAFCIEANYDYAQGLAYAGTYWQRAHDQFLYINKAPSSAPLVLGALLYVKSTKNIIGLDATHGTALIVPTPENSVSYGDILASCGQQDRLVVYTTVTSRLGQERGSCQVRVFEPH
ncbi:MAG: hypothetical protein LBU07_01245 [Coriobacteriales bacterium]|jgi:hypothetical protein|nr:hypothetical protein [Coriobacteriales bacterium]